MAMMPSNRALAVTPLESAVFGFFIGMLLGAFNEYQNYLGGNTHWVNFPENVGFLSYVLFGSVSLGLVLGYGIFGAILCVFVNLLASTVSLDYGTPAMIVGVLLLVGGAFMIVVNAYATVGLTGVIIGVALLLRSIPRRK